MGELVGEGRGFRGSSAVAQKFVNVAQSGSGENSLTADMPIAAAKVLEQVHLGVSPRRKVGVPPFAGNRDVPFPGPEQARLAEASARRDECRIAGGIGRSWLEELAVAGSQSSNAPCVSFEVVDQPDTWKPQLATEAFRFHHPGQVGGFTPPILHR